MTLFELALAVLVLLVTPGPTNTLMALAGAERGWARAVRLIPAELGGYLTTTVPLALLGASLLDALPAAKTLVTLIAATWVLWLAVSMWRVPHASGADPTVTARRLAVTTLLNPKALIFGLVLLPASDWGRLGQNFGLFATEVVAVAMAWALLGAVLRRPGGAQGTLPAAWRRGASVWLGSLAVYLIGRVAGLA
jgi:threonine/homoserine/homoserine lactone efflux protein